MGVGISPPHSPFLTPQVLPPVSAILLQWDSPLATHARLTPSTYIPFAFLFVHLVAFFIVLLFYVNLFAGF